MNDVTFAEDPLRVLRAAQFAARFGCRVADETVELAKTMDLTALPRERIFGELEKAFHKAEKPSVFFEQLDRMQHLHYWFPELEAQKGVPQDPVNHPEGDVWTHTMMVLDAAASCREQASQPLAFMMATNGGCLVKWLPTSSKRIPKEKRFASGRLSPPSAHIR